MYVGLPARWRRNPWLLAGLLAAFLSQALIPAGFMPGRGGLMLCSGYVPADTQGGGSAVHADSAPMDMSGMDMSAMDMSGMDMSGMDMSGMDMMSAMHGRAGGHAAPHGHLTACPFALAAAGLGPPSIAVTALLALTVHPQVVRFDEPVVARRAIVRTSLPRGPPHLS